jgi:hypothetical protein
MANFDIKFLNALSNWQKGWREDQSRRRQLADELIEVSKEIPEEFKNFDSPVYRKRFLIHGEMVPIVLQDEFFEGIASWTSDISFAKQFKGFVRSDAKFAVLFKHTPIISEVVLNIPSLWKDSDFTKAVSIFEKDDPISARALTIFKDSQAEVILRSTLKGSEIEDIVGVSSSFDELCDMAGIPEADRRELSARYDANAEGIPILIPSFVGPHATKNAITNTLNQFKDRLRFAAANSIPVVWPEVPNGWGEDRKHKPT